MADTREALVERLSDFIRAAEPRVPQPDRRLGPGHLGGHPPQPRTKREMATTYNRCLNSLKIEQCDALDSVIRELAHLLAEP